MRCCFGCARFCNDTDRIASNGCKRDLPTLMKLVRYRRIERRKMVWLSRTFPVVLVGLVISSSCITPCADVSLASSSNSTYFETQPQNLGLVS
ncbi:unnamed protein product [Protopolystoma xenopodis]|uniref:Uncharacterized protein n=1 Tax=Protopolystoma xenopodis TaxID=117903 RepID=A0A448XDD0_9PLAT|nr:unnamed protein product [Protopolystoma xenopodis]